MTSTSFGLSPATSSPINRPLTNACFSFSSVSPSHCNYDVNNINIYFKRRISCEVGGMASVGLENNPSSSSSSASESKIGARVRVKVPLKVYHVPRVPEFDLTGIEGVLKQYVAVWKGKTISANLPYKVEFVTEIEGRGAIKFFAHLKEDEFDFLD